MFSHHYREVEEVLFGLKVFRCENCLNLSLSPPPEDGKCHLDESTIYSRDNVNHLIREINKINILATTIPKNLQEEGVQ